MAEKPHVAVVKFDKYRNLQRYRAVLPVAFLFEEVDRSNKKKKKMERKKEEQDE